MNHGRIALAGVVLAALAAGARADYDPTHITWKGWRVESTESLYEGAKYAEYPLTHLFDGRKETAWVFSAKTAKNTKAAPAGERPEGRKIAVTLIPDAPVELDGIGIMGGYCKSDRLYYRNDRPAEVKITIEGAGAGSRKGEPLVIVRKLEDKPGLRKIVFARQAVRSVTIEVSAVAAGTVHDLCVSELELYQGGAKLDMNMPPGVRFTKGSDCGCGTQYALIASDGRTIARGSGGDMGNFACWDSRGRLLADVCYDSRKNAWDLWAADAALGRVLFRRPLPAAPAELSWRTAKSIHVEFEDHAAPAQDWVLPDAAARQGAWINRHAATPGLAGVKVQQFPDCEGLAKPYAGRHPAMLLYVFTDGRVNQVCFSPSGKVEQDFWWRAAREDPLWPQLDRTFRTPVARQ